DGELNDAAKRLAPPPREASPYIFEPFVDLEEQARTQEVCRLAERRRDRRRVFRCGGAMRPRGREARAQPARVGVGGHAGAARELREPRVARECREDGGGDRVPAV